MKWARIEDEIVREIIEEDPDGRFTDEIMNQIVVCPDDAEQHDICKDGAFSKPVITVDPKQDILFRISQLDKVVSFVTEQTYIDMGKTPSDKTMADAITEKRVLRTQLKELEGKTK